MAWVDTDYLDQILGPDIVDGYFRDSGTVDTAAQSQAIASAQSRVYFALRARGYTPPSDATMTTMLAGNDAQTNEAELLKLAVAGAFAILFSPRKQFPWPQPVVDAMSIFKTIENTDKRVEFTTLPLSTEGARGGHAFSEQDADVTGNFAPIFSRTMGR